MGHDLLQRLEWSTSGKPIHSYIASVPTQINIMHCNVKVLNGLCQAREYMLGLIVSASTQCNDVKYCVIFGLSTIQ